MVSVSYTPKYNHPVTQHDLNKLEPEILTNEVSRLQHSISHLERSNRELDEFSRQDDLDDDDKKDFVDSIKENEQTMIRLALSSKLGVDAANAHYTLASHTPVPSLPLTGDLPAPSQPVLGGPRWADDDEVEDERLEVGAASTRVASGGRGADGDGQSGGGDEGSSPGVVDEEADGVYL